jgi:SHS2 domain-containing protein
MSRKYELIEHTADIFIKAYGQTVAEAFGVVAEAMFSLMVDEAEIARTEQIEFSIDAIDQETLLVSYLSELIVIHEVQQLVFDRIEVNFDREDHLTARAWGEQFDEKKHRHGLLFKAASYHLMEIVESTADHPAYVKVLFDI